MNRVFRYSVARIVLLLVAVLTLFPYTASAEDTIELSEQATNDQPRITVTLSATGDNGLPILDLEATDVVVTENGVPQPEVVLYPFYEHPTPVDVVLALDTSVSMRGEPFEQSKAAAHNFIASVGLEDRVGIVGFGRAAELVHPLSTDRESLNEAVNDLQLTVNTALNDALIVASEEAARSTNPKVVVLMTDGANYKSQATLPEALEQVLPLKVPVMTVGFGEKVNDKALTEIASRTGGQYYNALNGSALTEVFEKIAQQLHQEYRVSYESTTVGTPGDQVEVKVALQGDAPAEQTFTYEYAARDNARSAGAPVSTGNLPVVNPGKPAEPIATSPYSGYALPVSGALATLALLVGLMLSSTPSPVQRRLNVFLDPLITGAAPRRQSSGLGALSRPLVQITSSLILRIMPATQQRKLVDNLAAAGYPRGMRLAHYVTLQAVVALIGAFLTFSFTQSVFFALVLGLISFFLPNYWLAKRIKRRRANILLQLPDALDLLTISVEAGLGFDAAVLEVVQKWDNELSREFAVMLGEMKLGKSRRDALRGMGKRVAVPEMKLFVGGIVQADEMGMSVGRTLGIQAEQMRIRRRQKAEELAHKAVIKIIFPMVIFIFPAIFVVLLGPSVPTMLKTISEIGK